MIDHPFSLINEVALVTGGGTGIGLAISSCLAQAGAKVILVGRRESVLQEAVLSIGERAAYEVFDITHLDRIPDRMTRIKERFGAPSILINNAGNHLKKDALETTDKEFAHVFDTHVMSAFSLSRSLAPGMIERGHGSIVFIASMTSLIGLPKTIAYAAAKSAYLGLVNTLATEFSPHGVRVNAIAPGFILTDISRKALDQDPQRLDKVLKRTPMNCRGNPDDIGYAAVYLCSPAAKFVTGIVLPVDGGFRIGF